MAAMSMAIMPGTGSCYPAAACPRLGLEGRDLLE
jgi:hypothetical protein